MILLKETFPIFDTSTVIIYGAVIAQSSWGFVPDTTWWISCLTRFPVRECPYELYQTTLK